MSAPGSRPQLSRGDKDFRIQARAVWEMLGERLKFSAQVQADYGKWLVATVAAVHLAALYLISQKDTPDFIRLSSACYWPFVVGILLIVISGLWTWLNFTMSSIVLIELMKPGMLIDHANWPANPTWWKRFWMRFTMYAAVKVGLASAGCILWGALVVFDKMDHPPKPQARQQVVAVGPAKPQAVAPQKPAQEPTNPGVKTGPATKSDQKATNK